MTWSKSFVELDKIKHDRNSFDCGEAPLNQFLKFHASKHMKSGISKTMVLTQSELQFNKRKSICAFYTITPSSISKRTLPRNKARKLPDYPIPVFLLAQLAVDNNYQKMGLGKISLIKALEHLWKIYPHMHAYAVIVDCLHEKSAEFFSKFGFEPLDSDNEKTRLFLTMKTITLLFE